MELVVSNYGTYVHPQNDMVGNIINACDDFSYSFTSGVYFLTGEIDIGAWSFAYSLTNDAKKIPVNYSSIVLNGNSVDITELRKQSFHVGQYKIYGKKTFKYVIEKALKTSKSNCTYNELLKKYDFYFEGAEEWRMNCVRHKIWYISPLVGLALKKKIFVFPWLSKKVYLSDFFQRAYDLLINEDVIVLVPCSEKIQFPTGGRYNVVRMATLFDIFIEHGFDFEKDHR